MTDKIEYTTEARVVLRDGMNIKGALTWRKSGDVARLAVGGETLVLTANMLEQIAAHSVQIVADLREGKGQVRAPVGGIGGVL